MKMVFYVDMMIRCGAQRVMCNLINFFLGPDNEIILINDFPLNDEVPHYSVPNTIKRYYLHNTNTKGHLFKNIKRIRLLRKILKKEQPDIAVSFLGRPNIRLLIATKGLRFKKIVSVRNDPRYEYGMSRLKRSFANWLFKRADGVVFQTEEARNYFNKIKDKKSFIISNSVDSAFYDINCNPCLNNSIVTFGRLEKQKNHAMLIDAFNLISNDFPEINLSIFGNGSLYPSLKEKIEVLNLTERIFLKGNTDAVAQELKNAKLFVLSSDYEGMPNSLMEAMAAGVPCISTDCPCGGPRMLIRSGVNGLLVPCKDKNALAAAMRTILSNKSIQKEFNEKAKESASLFLPDIVNKKWKNCFLTVYLEGR